MEEPAARLYRRELQSRGGKREMDPGTQLLRDGAIAGRAPISSCGALRMNKHRQVVAQSEGRHKNQQYWLLVTAPCRISRPKLRGSLSVVTRQRRRLLARARRRSTRRAQRSTHLL